MANPGAVVRSSKVLDIFGIVLLPAHGWFSVLIVSWWLRLMARCRHLGYKSFSSEG